MKKITLIFFYIFYSIYTVNASTFIPYDNSVLSNIDSSWIEPFEYYITGNIISVLSDKIEIDIGIEDGIQHGLIYDIYQNNRAVGKIIITKINNDYSSGYIYEKSKNPFERDQVRFSGMIDIDENPSYLNRIYIKVISKVTFIDESGLCFIEGDKNSNIKKDMHFDILDNSGKISGEIEIIDDSGKDNIIVAQVTKTYNKIQIGDKAVSQPRNNKHWMEFAAQLEKDEKNILDAIFAYEMALKLSKEHQGYLKNKLLILVTQKAMQYEQKEQYDKAFIIRNKILGFTKETDNEYFELKDKIHQLAKENWSARLYFQCIKYYELLDKEDLSVKYLSFSYNGLGYEMLTTNPLLSIYCFKKSVKLIPGNTKAWKNLAEIYEVKQDYDSAIENFEKLYLNSSDEEEKKWTQNRIDSLKLKKGNIIPNIIFSDLNGKIINLSDYKGSGILLVFWKKNHQISDENMEFINTYLDTTGRNKIAVLLINNNDNLEENIIKEYIREKNINNLEAVIPKKDISNIFPDIYKVSFMNILLDTKGKIIYQKEEIFGDELESLIKNLE
ncbi:MAG: redoxin domain-containing protein [Candidatus Firestonebacteria bacterium]|nr:redoxin domain-containing protein [Candidatus Firestonebacteria bacterium]